VRWIDTDATAAGTWDRQATHYARQERLEFRAVDAAIELAAPMPPDRIVDLATGTGLLLRRLAAADGRPRVAVGVDRSPGMLERVGPLPVGWSTIRADARHTPLADGSADVVTCVYLLQLRDPPQRGAVLAEARRLLAPGAGSRLVVVTPWADPRRPAGRIVRAALTLLADVRPASLGGLRACDPTADLVDAGFVVTRRRVLPRGGYPSLVLLARLSRSA
jgi:ubiquinone/menaquinone biosynthesis C-methylase UbiE